jgi:hypothetical protein
MHALLAVQGHERAVGQIPMRRRPGVEGLAVGQQLGRPVAEDQRQQRQQGGQHAVLGVESSRDIRKFTISDHRQVHALDPARHIGRTQAQTLRRRRITPQVRVQRRHEAEVRQAGVAAQQVGPVLEMFVEHVEQVEELRLDGLGGVRVGAQGPQHAAEVAHHPCTGLVARGLVGPEVGGPAELGLQKAALQRNVGLGPAKMHGHGQQVLAAIGIEQPGQRPQHRCLRNHGALGQTPLHRLDDLRGVLHDVPLRVFPAPASPRGQPPAGRGPGSRDARHRTRGTARPS